jgi:hypothetical protein
MRGAGGYRPNVRQAVDYLKAACRHSAEAALRLGIMYMKGSKIRQDFEESYFYLRLATLFRCKCGNFKEEYHNGTVSNVHPCYPTEAMKFLNRIPRDNESE